MKLKYIIGILVCLISLTGTALATDYYAVLDTCSEPDSKEKQYVTASVSGNVVTFSTLGINSTPTGWFYIVGLPEGVTVLSVQDKNGDDLINLSNYYVTECNIGDFTYLGSNEKITFTNVFLYNYEPNKLSKINVTLDKPLNDPAPIFAARVGWEQDCNLSSAYFMGTGNTTEIPEFPTIALPVAAMLGLMFIFGRRKEE